MLRFLGCLVVAVLILVLVAGGVLWWKRTSLAGNFLAKGLNTTVCLDEALFRGHRISLENLTVDTPNHSESTVPALFAASRVDINASPFELLQNEVVISEIAVDNCILGVVLYNKIGSDNSWSRILSDRSALPSSNKSVIVKKLNIYNLYINLYSEVDNKQIQIPAFAHVEIDNIGAGARIPLNLLSEIIIDQVMDYVLNNVDVAALLLKAVGASGNPAVEVPALMIQQMIKQGLQRPKSNEMPMIPRGKHCFTP